LRAPQRREGGLEEIQTSLAAGPSTQLRTGLEEAGTAFLTEEITAGLAPLSERVRNYLMLEGQGIVGDEPGKFPMWVPVEPGQLFFIVIGNDPYLIRVDEAGERIAVVSQDYDEFKNSHFKHVGQHQMPYNPRFSIAWGSMPHGKAARFLCQRGALRASLDSGNLLLSWEPGQQYQVFGFRYAPIFLEKLLVAKPEATQGDPQDFDSVIQEWLDVTFVEVNQLSDVQEALSSDPGLDAVVVDVSLLDQSAEAFIQSVRSQSGFENIPILFVGPPAGSEASGKQPSLQLGVKLAVDAMEFKEVQVGGHTVFYAATPVVMGSALEQGLYALGRAVHPIADSAEASGGLQFEAALDVSGDIASLLPAAQIQSRDFMESGISGWRRIVYTLADGAHRKGGMIHESVTESQIHETAYVSPGSMVRGPATRLEAGAAVLNAAVTDSAIREHATLLNSVAEQALVHPRVVLVSGVLEPAFDEESWSYSDSTRGILDLWVKNHRVKHEGQSYQVELGKRLVSGGSVFQSASVGPDSAVAGSAVVSSRWGEQTALTRVKSLLAVAAVGHADVAGVEHQPDGTETPALHEVGETAYRGLLPEQHPGLQIRERRTGYTEVVVNNRVTLVSTPDHGKTLRFTSVFVPPATLFGDYAIFSIFAGAPAPDGVVTDGWNTPRLIRRLTGRPGEQSSQHGRIAAEPLSIVAAFSNVIGRLLALPNLNDPEALASEDEITHLGAFSGAGVGARTGLHGWEAWGQMFPGEAKGRLTRAAGIAPWAFFYAPEAVFYLLGQIVQGLPEKYKHRYDTLPQRLLESGLALSQHALRQEQAKEGQSDQRVVERLVRYVACYTALIDSGAWTGNWVLEDGLYHPDHWSRLDGEWQSDLLPPGQLHAIVHPDPASVPYRQFSVRELMALPEGVERPDWAERLKLYLETEDLEPEQPMTPLGNLGLVPAEAQYQERQIIGQDGLYYYTVQGGRISKEIPLDHIDPAAVIGTGTVLTGKSTWVGSNSRLFFVMGEDLQAGAGVRLNAVRAGAGVIIENNVKLSWAKLGAGAQIGPGSQGAYIGVAEGSVVAANTVFEPFGVAVNSTTSPGNTIGVSLMHSNILPGFMGRHSSAHIHHLDHRPVCFTVNGRPYDLGAASLNAAGGVFVEGREDAKVPMSAAYPLSLTTIRPRAGSPASEVGTFSILKNLVILEREIFHLTFHAFSNVAQSDPLFATPGRHNDRIGGALDYPGIFLRNFIPRTKGGIWDDLVASGNYPDERLILRHPRMRKADYAVEALITETLRAVHEQLSGIDPEAAGHLDEALLALLRFMDEDLDQIRKPNQAMLGPRTPEQRDEIQSLIQRVMNCLRDLPGQRPTKELSSSGHTAEQLLGGIRRMARNLDGRWRMRDHTFTEVRWEYVAYEGDKARDTWVPMPLGSVVRNLFVKPFPPAELQFPLAPGVTSLAQERAQAILALVETASDVSAETEAEAWQTVPADLHGFLGNDLRRAWATEVFEHLHEMKATTPAQASIQQALRMLETAGLSAGFRGAAGLEEETPAALEKTAVDLAALRQEKALLPSMKAAVPGVGVLASGLEDVRGPALGALLSQVATPGGEPMPVVILARSQAEKVGLEELGSAATILLIPEYPSAGAAISAGEQMLKTLYGIRRIIDLGARSPITSTLDRLLSRLGIRLSQKLLPRLQSWLDRAIEALEFA